MLSMSEANCPHCGGRISQSRISCAGCGRLFPLAIAKTWFLINLRLLKWGAIVTAAAATIGLVFKMIGIKPD